MKNQLKKTLSIVLMACMLLSAVPVWASAAEDTSTAEVPQEQTLSTSQAEPAAQAEEVTVLWEDESLRGEYEKHFLMSDGSYQVEVYAYPVHELVDGVWVEIESNNQNARSDVSPGSAQTNILDNFVWEGHGVQSSTGLRLYIGSRSGYTARTYIQFATMPTIPAGSTITAATMKLTMVSGTSLAYTANAYQVTGGEWTPTTIQWSNKPAANVLLASNISNNDRTKYQFSVLTAVRHWYDGDPTGQNENYGIMLRYYDESLTGYYNSVYSGDVVDTNSRPKLTISYTPPNNEVSMLVGKTRTLTVSDYTGTITWTSSDPSVASVSSSGVVTSIKLGSTTITAYGGGNELKKFNVYVKIQDGVYYIRNISADMYLGSAGGTSENTHVSLYYKQTSGIEQLRQLWRITYLEKGYYCIRPLYLQTMSLFSSDDNDLSITTIGLANNFRDIPLVNCWGIEDVSGGYLIKHVNTISLSLRWVTPYYEHSVATEAYRAGSNDFLWEFEKVDTLNNSFILLDNQTGSSVQNITRYVAPGEEATLKDLGLTLSFVSLHSMDQSIVCTSLNSSVVTAESSTGTVTGLASDSSATIVYKHIHNGVEYSKSIVVYVTSFPENVYAIGSKMQYTTEYAFDYKYLAISDSDEPNEYITPGAPIEMSYYFGQSHQSWVFNSLNNGYYSLLCGSSGLALTVEDATSGNASLYQEEYWGSSRQQWSITLLSSGNYRIRPRSHETEDVTLAINGNDVQLGAYSDDSDLSDEWMIYESGNEVYMLGMYDPEIDMYSLQGTIMSCLQNAGYNSFDVNYEDSFSVSGVLFKMGRCKVYVSVCHGDRTYSSETKETYIVLGETNDKCLYTSDIYDFETGQAKIDLSDCDLMIFLACQSAYHEGTSLNDAAVAAGASSSIGFKNKVSGEYGGYWLRHFFKYYCQGFSIDDCASKAARDCSYTGNVDTYRIVNR